MKIPQNDRPSYGFLKTYSIDRWWEIDHVANEAAHERTKTRCA